MSEEQKRILEQQLWNIADTLRGRMNADEFRDYILGFIFYKYLAEKMEIYADSILKPDGIKYKEIKENTEKGKEYIEAIREASLEKLGYFLKPSELFGELVKRGNGLGHDAFDTNQEQIEDIKSGKLDDAIYDSQAERGRSFILEDLQKILINIQNSTMGTDSEEDFDNLFEDMDLNSTKLGKTPVARNTIIAKVLAHLDKIDFRLKDTELDVLGDAYEYFDLYDNSSLNFEKLLPFLEERYQVKFCLDTVESDNYLGKIEFNPLCIKISKSARSDRNRWRFTLAHEIGHLILHSKILKDRLSQKNDDEQTLSINFSQSKSNSDRLEIQANLFASNLLLPEKILLPKMNSIFIEYRMHRRLLYLDHQKVNQREVFEILNKLSYELQVSVEAIKIRLIKLNLMVDKTDSSIKTLIRNM